MYKTDCKKMRATSAKPLEALPVQQEGWDLDLAVRATGLGGAGDVRIVDVQPLLRAAQKSRSMAQTYLLECAQLQAEEEMRLEALEEGDESDEEIGVGVAGEEATWAKEDQSEEEVQFTQEGKGYEGSGDDGGMDEDAAADCARRGEDRVLAPGDQEKRDWVRVFTPVKGFCAAEEPDLPEAAGGVEPMLHQEAQGLEEMGAEGQKGGGEARDFTPAKEARRRHCFISGIPTTPPRFPSSLAPEQVQHGAEKSDSNAGGHGRDGRPPRRWIVDAKQGTRWDCAPSLLGGMRSGVLEPATGYDMEVTGEGEGGGGGKRRRPGGRDTGRRCEGERMRGRASSFDAGRNAQVGPQWGRVTGPHYSVRDRSAGSSLEGRAARVSAGAGVRHAQDQGSRRGVGPCSCAPWRRESRMPHALPCQQ